MLPGKRATDTDQNRKKEPRKLRVTRLPIDGLLLLD